MSCFDPESFCVRERATAWYRATLLDQDGLLLPGSALSTLSLTLYVKGALDAVVNARDDEDVLNTGGVTVYDDLMVYTTAGLEVYNPSNTAHTGLTPFSLEWEISPDDNAILGTKAEEKHVALFRYTWNAGLRADWHAVILLVQNQAVVV